MAERIQMRRAKGWRLPAGAIYVGRPTRWGNPFVPGAGAVTWHGPTNGPHVGQYRSGDPRVGELDLPPLSQEQAVWLYRQCLIDNLADGDVTFDELRGAVKALAGHDLACWCGPDEPCHADVLLELANR